METITYTAPDISCEHCRKTIETAVGALPGIAGVQVDIVGKRVEIRYDPAQIGTDRIESTLDEEGYPIQS